MTDLTEAREWLILNNGCFYRPYWSGYTMKKADAGGYTEAEARKEVAFGDPGYIRAIHKDDAPDDPAAAWRAALKEEDHGRR